MGAGMRWPKSSARHCVSLRAGGSLHKEERTRHIPGVRIDEHTGNDTPAVERLSVRPVGPAHARIRVGVEERTVIQFLLGRVHELVRVHGERWNYKKSSLWVRSRERREGTHAGHALRRA
jgi:hypothetical protein